MGVCIERKNNKNNFQKGMWETSVLFLQHFCKFEIISK